MIYLGVFILEIVLLFFLSKSLIRSLADLCYRLTHSHNATINILAILFFPGTVIHELAHLLVAGVMFVPLGELEVMPRVHEDGSVQLGSVQIGQTDPFRRTIIGVAPILVGLGLIFTTLFLFKDSLINFSPLWQVILALYLIFEITNTMFSSKKDMEGVVAFVISIVLVLVIVFGILLLMNLNPLPTLLSLFQKINLNSFNEFLRVSVMYMTVPLGVDLGLILLTSLISYQKR